ncbi:hypothetical protein DERP_009519 [Dermatophagoides pteronyssinus]|uniref:Uncharacterized protein n=1 Tax=Dermatophagoides pteronyssinus TaxID=6956 RepID=A0ABQ8IUC8_DERPT|nr:hypothetical protein DERP_009519 [Dermatophagoides pteronyssinus]
MVANNAMITFGDDVHLLNKCIDLSDLLVPLFEQNINEREWVGLLLLLLWNISGTKILHGKKYGKQASKKPKINKNLNI